MDEPDSDALLKRKVITLEGFLRKFIRQHVDRPDRPFCFILGAGASVESGIPSGQKMAHQWLKELHELRDHEGLSLSEWLAKNPLNIENLDPENPGAHYSALYEEYFGHNRDEGFAYLESAMKNAEPSYGYSVLSYLLSSTHHRIVITTNFDNLITDSLAVHSDTFAIVVNEDSLVRYVSSSNRRPLVAKIHGSLAFKPKSKSEELVLDPGWQEALSRILSTHTPVVIGYDGNDQSLMKYLLDADENTPDCIYWCYYCEDGKNGHGTFSIFSKFPDKCLGLSVNIFMPLKRSKQFAALIHRLNQESFRQEVVRLVEEKYPLNVQALLGKTK